MSEATKTWILIAYGVICTYYCLALLAAWVRPGWQRFWLLKPRWRGGFRASRAGLTAQAVFAFMLTLAGVTKMFGLAGAELFMGLLIASTVGLIIAWGLDIGSDIKSGR